MKTREELLAAAEALEWASERLGEAVGFLHVMDTIDARAAELRAQASQVPEQEPVAWQPIDTAPRDNKRMLLLARFIDGKRSGDIDYDGVWESETDGWENGNNRSWFWKSANGIDEPTHWMYQPEWYDNHPAPAPVEHTAADAPSSNAGNLQALKAAKEPFAVGVPDVAGLIAEISKRPLQRPTSEILAEAATALAALQGRLAQLRTGTNIQKRELCLVLEQQSAQIKEMWELLNWLHIQGGLGLDKHKRIEELLERTK